MARFGEFGIFTATIVMAAVTSATPAVTQPRAPGELRCGWYHNPTPGNHLLFDRLGRWILNTQGSQTPGMNRMPDMTTSGWVRTNGYYGYGCGCVRMTVNHRTRQVLRIHSGRPVPLRQCRNDRTLPDPIGWTE